MKHIKGKEAQVQLSRLKNLQGNALDNKKNKLSGLFRLDSYEWIAFDNRSGNLWVGTWQHPGECLKWLDENPG